MRLESSSAAGQLLEAMMTEVEPEFPLGICASLQNVKPEQQHARALLPTQQPSWFVLGLLGTRRAARVADKGVLLGIRSLCRRYSMGWRV